ncbi:hypothetical protein EDC04DRAFT_2888431 [Pisolithus marmoratus]|nr:hypothetical protein EDC04DRAFT_2888431 [Pisolithus marmoratus]
MKKAIEKEPGILFAVIILIKERLLYCTPKVDSDTAKVLCAGPYQNEIEFLPSMLNLIKVAQVTIEGHVWVDIKAVEWHVWLRGASPIDFNKTPTNFFAKGMLFPSINMLSMDALLTRGLAAVCNRLLSEMQSIWLNNDHTALAAWSPATSTNWRAEEPNILRSGYDCDNEPLEGYDGDVLQDYPEEAFYLPGPQSQDRSNMEPEDNGYGEEFNDGACSQQDRHIDWDDDNNMQNDGLDMVIHPDGKSHLENKGGYESGSKGGDEEDKGEEDIMDYPCAYKVVMKLKFYLHTWRKVLHITGMYCCFVTTVNRFPNCMDIVEDEFGAEILLQSIEEFKAKCSILNMSYYEKYAYEMKIWMYSDLGDLWLAVKKGTVENFGCMALTQTCVLAVYDGKMSLATAFPEKFGRILPGGAHVFSATMLALALDEYADGHFQCKQVKSDNFETIYDKLRNLFDKVEDSGHYDVLEACHKQIAMLGCSHNPKAKPQKMQFHVFL